MSILLIRASGQPPPERSHLVREMNGGLFLFPLFFVAFHSITEYVRDGADACWSPTPIKLDFGLVGPDVTGVRGWVTRQTP